ncbi:MAG: 3-phosphoshikimate 1-carboxyvinyltransferase, partial [Euryarchaeota archaeon]|nr:3-phosphoshikimate 1-carboxyvinyltransferase [Euryarchaeota archaeon]
CALGTTKFFGVSELRVKESDRISSVANGLRKCGVSVSDTKDTMEIIGKGAGSVTGGVLCESNFDHRIAMSFLCLGLASVNKISVDDVSSIDTSFPTFFSLMTNLGAEMKREVN